MRDGELIKELRHERGVHDYDLRPLCRRVADALSRLEAENARLREAIVAEKRYLWGDGRRNGIKWAISFIHGQASRMNDPSARAALSVCAADMGHEARHTKAARAALSPPPPEPAR